MSEDQLKKCCEICGNSEPHEHSGFGKWSNNEGLLKERILQALGLTNEDIKAALAGKYEPYLDELTFKDLSMILDEAKKDLLTNLHVRSDSEALCILINKIKKWFGNQ